MYLGDEREKGVRGVVFRSRQISRDGRKMISQVREWGTSSEGKTWDECTHIL